MRYMMIVKANADTESGKLPTSEMLAEMGRYNEELIAAGILLAAEGLLSSSTGARVKFERDKITVQDGPFSETKELVGGFWVINVKSKDEALEWAKRIPFRDGEEVELRKVAEVSDFEVDAVSEEHLKKEAAWREANQKPIAN